jgi:hypothetical protein
LTISECGDSVEQAAAVADRRDTQLAQVLSREPAQARQFVVAERGRVLFEPEAAQPFGHFHWSCPETASLVNHYNSGAAFCLLTPPFPRDTFSR